MGDGGTERREQLEGQAGRIEVIDSGRTQRCVRSLLTCVKNGLCVSAVALCVTDCIDSLPAALPDSVLVVSSAADRCSVTWRMAGG